jgi:predicted ATPase/transcriptional regulator with XRE-family HTH domain
MRAGWYCADQTAPGGCAEVPDTFAELLRRFRVAASLTQEALAERCRLSPDTIAALEQGRRRAPRLSTVSLISGALGLTAAERAALAGSASRVPGPPAQGASPAVIATGLPDGAVRSAQDTWRRRPLPAPLTPLFGRHAEVELVAHELASERLVTLTGPGGVGKTRLALRVADRLRGKFEGGTWWAELGPVNDTRAVTAAVLAAVGGAEQPGLPLTADQIIGALPAIPALLVIDNCEHVLDAASGLIATLLRAPSITILTTTREPLAIPGEVVWPVPPLAFPESDTASAETLADLDSVQLFVERATRARPTFTLTDEAAGDVARICRRLEGIPLAIELTAARVRALGVRELADELEAHLALAATRSRGVPERQATLWASVDWSYQLLSQDERAAFRCLACFAGTFSLDAVTSVCGQVTGLGRREVVEVFARLVGKSLVAMEDVRREGHDAGTRPGTAAGEARYRVLDSIRAYATQAAEAGAELARIADAHADYYGQWLVMIGAAEPTDEVLVLITEDYPNVRAALTWSVRTGAPRAAELVAALGQAWHLLSLFTDAVELGDAATALVAEADQDAWSKAVAALGLTRLLAGDAAFVAGAMPRAAAIAVARGDAYCEGWCKLVQGSLPPRDPAWFTSAYELGTAARSPSLAAIAAAHVSVGGSEADAGGWANRIERLAADVPTTSVRATCDIALIDILIERGHMDAALDLAMAATTNPRVMPSLRILGLGRIVNIAFQRRDQDLADRASALMADLARAWPPGGMLSFKLQELRLGLLRGEHPPGADFLAWSPAMAFQPGGLRTICRNSIDRGERLDPGLVAGYRQPPEAGSLLAASIRTIDGAWASLDEDDDGAAGHWTAVLRAAADHGYALLACDALEALAGLASRRRSWTVTARLLTAADRLRAEIGYRFRFDFEQAAVDQARADITAACGDESAGLPPSSPPDWRDTADLALRTFAPA